MKQSPPSGLFLLSNTNSAYQNPCALRRRTRKRNQNRPKSCKKRTVMEPVIPASNNPTSRPIMWEERLLDAFQNCRFQLR